MCNLLALARGHPKTGRTKQYQTGKHVHLLMLALLLCCCFAAALLLAACGLRPTGPSPRLDVHGRHLWAGLIGKFRLSRFAHHSR